MGIYINLTDHGLPSIIKPNPNIIPEVKLAEKTTRFGSDSFNRSNHQITGNAKRPSRAHGIRKDSGPTFHIIRLWNLPIVASKEHLEHFPALGLSCER